MKKLFTFLLISFFALSFSQVIDSTKNIYDYKGIDEIRNLKGLELLAIPRANKKNPIDFPGVYIYKHGDYIEIKNIDDYEFYFSNKKFKIDDVKENSYFIDIYMSNENEKIKWSKSPTSLSEKAFISVPFYEFVKKKVENKSFIYSKRRNQYDNVKSLYEYSTSDFYTTEFFGLSIPESEYARFMEIKFITIDSENKEKTFLVNDFDYSRYYNTSEYYTMFTANKLEKEERGKKILKKYGKSIGERILDGDVWIGMTKEMLINSKGDKYRIGTIYESGNYYSVDYIYGDTYYTFVNGKLDSIISL